MKDVVRCDKSWGAANRLCSVNFRMGKPTFDTRVQRSVPVLEQFLETVFATAYLISDLWYPKKV